MAYQVNSVNTKKEKKPCKRKQFKQPTKMENLVTWPKLILNKDHLVETFLGRRFITATYCRFLYT